MDSQYIGRWVTLLQPLFVAAAGAIVTYVGTEVPGVNLDGTELAGLFAVGAAAAASAVYKWLDNRGKHEQALAASAGVAAAAAPGPPQTLTYNPKTNTYEIGVAT